MPTMLTDPPPTPRPQPGVAVPENPLPVAPLVPNGGGVLERSGVPSSVAQALDAAMARNTAARQQAATTMEGLRNQQTQARQAMAEIPHTPPPKFEDLPDAPPTQKPTDTLRVFGQVLPVLAMLGGAFVRNNASAALQAGASAMNAARQNDQTALEQAHQQWTDHLQAIRARNESVLQRWNAIANDEHMSRQDKLAEFNAIAAEMNSEVALENVRSGDLAPLIQYGQMYQNAHNQLVQQMQHVEQMNADPRRQIFAHFRQQFEAEHGRAPNAEEESQFLQSMNPRIPFAAISARRAFLREAVPQAHQQLLAMYPRMQSFVQAALQDGDAAHRAAAQLELLDSFVQMVNGGRAIREFQVAGITHYQTVAGNLEQAIGRLRNGGGPLSSQSIEDVLRVADEYKEAVEGAYAPQEGAFRQRLLAMGIDPDQAINDPDLSDQSNLLSTYLGDNGAANAPMQVTTPEEAQALPPGTHYQTPDGQEFIR